MKIRTQLFVLIVVALLPIVAFGVVMTARFWNLQRDSYDQQFLERVRALRLAVDTEIDGTIRLLQSLAQSPALDETSLGDFRDRLQRIVNAQPGWATLGVIGADGTTLATVHRTSFDTPVSADPKTTAAVVSGRAPAVSNLLVSADGKAYLTFIAVPVIRGPDVTAVLYVGIEHRGWLDFLRRYPVDTRETLTLVDRDGLIIARTLNDDRWVGKPPAAQFAARIRDAHEGAFLSDGLEGQPFYSAFSRSALSGWTLGTGVPQADVEQAGRESTLLTLGGFAAAALVALVLALLLGRKIDGVLAALEDSAARLRERQESLNEAMARDAQARAVAEHANVAKDQFLAMLGHELRNPLSAISNASALLDRTPDAAVAARMRAIVQRQVQHLVRIVNDLLDVARVTSGKVVLTKAVVDLAVVVVHAVEALKDAGRFAGLSLDVRVDSAPVLGDETRLEQIAMNLIENACKYTPAGGHVRVRVAVRDGAVELVVEDDGSGIAPELLPHVFDLFVQGERTLDRAQGGLGLGLPVVKRLVELHGGTVSVHSDGLGQGSRFIVQLPQHVGRPDAVQPIVGPSPAGRLSVALVEDHADTRESLRVVLQQEGHDVAVAHDGPGGVELILRTRPEIALVDIGIPGFDGLELARRVRAEDPEHRTRLVALTGYGAAEDRAAALEAGFDEYMVKPFDLARFRTLTTREVMDVAD